MVSDIGFNIKEENGITVITPLGRIDVSRILNLKKVFEELENKAVLKIAINMTDVEFIDSSGVGLLANFMGRQKKREGHLVFYSCSSAIMDLLDVTGLVQVVPIYKTFEDVKARFSKECD